MNNLEIKDLQKKYAEQIGERIRIMRESVGYTQEELGRYIDKGYSMMSRYECGTAPLAASDVPILTKACNRQPSYLYQFKESIKEECELLQNSIHKSIKFMKMMKMADTHDNDIGKQSYMKPLTVDSCFGGFSPQFFNQLSDTCIAFFMYDKNYISEEKLQEYIKNIYVFDYSKQKSYFDKYDFEDLE